MASCSPSVKLRLCQTLKTLSVPVCSPNRLQTSCSLSFELRSQAATCMKITLVAMQDVVHSLAIARRRFCCRLPSESDQVWAKSRKAGTCLWPLVHIQLISLPLNGSVTRFHRFANTKQIAFEEIYNVNIWFIWNLAAVRHSLIGSECSIVS